MEIEDVEDRLSEDGYSLLPQVLNAEEAKRLEHICRERIEARNVHRGHATGGGDQYISLEYALNVVPELASATLYSPDCHGNRGSCAWGRIHTSQ